MLLVGLSAETTAFLTFPSALFNVNLRVSVHPDATRLREPSFHTV